MTVTTGDTALPGDASSARSYISWRQAGFIGVGSMVGAGIRPQPYHRRYRLDDVLREHHRHGDGGRIVWQLRQRDVHWRRPDMAQGLRGPCRSGNERRKHRGIDDRRTGPDRGGGQAGGSRRSRAVLADPRILILDEATSRIDPTRA